jgi:hypothetical protein
VAPGPPAPAGSSVNSNSSKPSKSSASVTNAVLAGTAAGAPEASADEAAASFRAASKRSGSLVPRRLSGSINSSVESSVPAFRDPVGAEPPWDEGAAPTDAPSSMGASTGRSESGSKTGREAASIISSLVDASSNANLRSAEQARLHGRVPKPVAFGALPLSKQCRGAVASRWLTQRSVGAPECDASHTLLATLCPSQDRPTAPQVDFEGRGRPLKPWT